MRGENKREICERAERSRVGEGVREERRKEKERCKMRERR